MNISEVKDLMNQFDGSSLREFSYKNTEVELSFSKNEQTRVASNTTKPISEPQIVTQEVSTQSASAISQEEKSEIPTIQTDEGEEVESPLVGVAYLSPAPDKPAFVSVGDSVKKGQTLLIIEAMKVMNEVPALCDGVVTEILVSNEEMVEFGQGLVRIK